MQYGFFSDDDYIQLGVSYSKKDRKSEYQKFYLDKHQGYGIDDYSNLPGGDPEALLDEYVRDNDDYDNLPWLIKDLFNPADYFDATVKQTDTFFNIFTKS